MSSFDRRVKELAMIAVAFAAAFMVMLVAEGTFVKSVEASPLCSMQPIIAYNIDFEMDSATAEQTIEYYGEEIREFVEQALRNNQNHPERKSTAKNSYQRESALNDLLPEARSSAFSKETLSDLRKTKNPKDVLK
ncbi:MAG: hypothetical protein AAFV85_24315 [Cyanobacteria bacterium J06634_6]